MLSKCKLGSILWPQELACVWACARPINRRAAWPLIQMHFIIGTRPKRGHRRHDCVHKAARLSAPSKVGSTRTPHRPRTKANERAPHFVGPRRKGRV